MYNVALDTKVPVHTNLDISETAHFLYHKTASLQHWTSEAVQSSVPIHVKKICGFKDIRIGVDWGFKLLPEVLGNCSFVLLDELCSDKSADKRDLSLKFKKFARNNCY